MKYTFLILSNQPFDFELKTNKWHVANTLAKFGHKVVYVDPPLRFKALKKIFSPVSVKNENLTVYSPVHIFNFSPFSYINTWFHSRKIKKLLEAAEVDEDQKGVLWVYHFDYPDLRNFLKKFNYDLLIYDVVDEYTAFPEYSERKKVNPSVISWIQWLDDELKIHFNQNGLQKVDWVLNQEKWLADNADLMFASAPNLVDKFKKWRDQVAYLPNAVDYKKFDLKKGELEEPEDLKNIPSPRIGFTGAIDTYKNNIPLIERCAEAYPEYSFVIIGPEKVSDPDLDLTRLKSMQNVYFLGKKPWEQTPAYFCNFDAYFIPYQLNEATDGVFPIKYFEGLAAGLPTIVTNLRSYEGFDPDGYVSKNDDEFISNIKKALEENSIERIDKRKQMAKENSWEGKVNKQLALINEFFKTS